MSNTFESEVLSSLKEDLEIYNGMIREVSGSMLKDEISKYPIFIAHKEDLTVGRVIIDHVSLATDWSISASHLEEFVSKKIILADKVESFKQIYKNPMIFICLFVISDGQANFVFNPF